MAIKAYEVYVARHAFDVAPDESNLFFCEHYLEMLRIYTIDASSGAVISSYQDSSFGIDESFSFITVSEDSLSVHISGSSEVSGNFY